MIKLKLKDDLNNKFVFERIFERYSEVVEGKDFVIGVNNHIVDSDEFLNQNWIVGEIELKSTLKLVKGVDDSDVDYGINQVGILEEGFGFLNRIERFCKEINQGINYFDCQPFFDVDECNGVDGLVTIVVFGVRFVVTG